MKRSNTVLAGIGAALALSTAAAVYAQGMMGPGGGFGMGPGMGGMMGSYGMGGRMAQMNPAERIDSHLASWKAALRITTGQEGAWQAFETVAREQAGSMQAMHAAMHEATGTAPERFALHTEMMKQHVGNMDAMAAAWSDLYAVLTPEQKALADQGFGMMGGRGMRFQGPTR